MEIPLQDLSDWNRLDAAAFRVSMGRSVRRLGWILATVGAVVVICGVAGAFVPLWAVGLVFMGAGVWNLCRPSIAGLLVDGLAVILAGTFNCLAWLWIDHAHASSIGNWIITGLVQIVWGVRRLATYRTARFAANDPRAVAHLEAVVKALSKRNVKEDPTVAEFWTGRLYWRRNRLGLYDEGAVALFENEVVRLERRTDLWIEASGTTWHSRSIKVRIQMSDLALTGRMATAHFERFERWKLGRSQARSVAA